jgi:hypothetical protein
MTQPTRPFFDYGAHRRRVVEMMCLACCAVFKGAWIDEVDTEPFIERCPQCGTRAAKPVAGEA